MILAIDIGNTNIVIGCIKNDKILFVERLSTDHTKTVLEYAISFKNVLELYHLKSEDIHGTIISSVVPPVTSSIQEAVEKITQNHILTIGPGVKTGLNILMDNPAQLGSDLVANAVAAINEYTAPLIVFDLGTATTISVIDEKKNYIGGIILPGIRVSSDSLTSQTAQLPRISFDAPKKIIGKNTIECMKSGVIYGNAAVMDGMIQRIEKELGQTATVLATGGLAEKIVPFCSEEIMLDNGLLLKGLNYIYKKNMGN